MRVAVWSASGVGGTEKAAILFATALASRSYRIDFLGPPGPRTMPLEKLGVPQLDILFDEQGLIDYVQRQRPDVIHQHVPGYPINNPLYRVWDRFGPAAPALIETNVFGRLDDPIGARLVKFRMFVSLSCAVKAFRRAGRVMSSKDLENHTVLYNPLEPLPVVNASRRAATREGLGIQATDILALRIGQISNKWTTWECQAFSRARRRAPQLRLLVMEPPSVLRSAIESGRYGPGIIWRPITSDFQWLHDLYASADLMIHAADHGESFGYTIAEAMAAGLPVIVMTTPWGDTAQAELVQNGTTGFVCASIGEMARRLVDLAGDPRLRVAMGRAAHERISRIANLSQEADILEAVIHQVRLGKRAPLLDARTQEILDFAKSSRDLEWTISESPASHPVDYARARAYNLYRLCRTSLGRCRNWLRSLQSDPSPPKTA